MTKNKDKAIGVNHFLHPQWPHYEAPQEITRILEKTYHYGEGGYRTFEKWIEICHLTLDGLPNLVHQVAQGIPPHEIQDSPELQAKWQKAIDGLRPELLDLFAQAFAILLEATVDAEGQLSYADVVGSVFQFFGVSKSHQKYAGIFFTPFNVAYMMAQMTLIGIEEELKQRFIQALDHESVKTLGIALSLGCLAAEAMGADEQGLELALTKLLPLVKSSPAWEPIRICDPCVGSGVMLLAAAKSIPRYAIDLGLVQFYGVDISPLCVEMCRLNMRLYGLQPLGIQPADLLSLVELQALPEPYPELYERAIADADPGRDYWIQQVRSSGVMQAPLWVEEEIR